MKALSDAEQATRDTYNSMARKWAAAEHGFAVLEVTTHLEKKYTWLCFFVQAQ